MKDADNERSFTYMERNQRVIYDNFSLVKVLIDNKRSSLESVPITQLVND